MSLGYKFGMAVILFAVTSFSASAAELAVLRNGFTIHHQSRDSGRDVTRLYLGETAENYVDVPTSEIIRFESEDLPLRSVPSPHRAVTLEDAVDAAASRNNIDRDLIMSVIRAESASNPNALSPKGAQGLMQLMPQTASWLGVENPMDPVANVEGGTRYLRELLERYHNDLVTALAAYNAGPKRVEQYRGVPPYAETRTYVAKVIGDFHRKKLAQERAQRDHANKPQVQPSSESTARSLPQPSGTRMTRSDR
jgi:Transglycosylase SLT domain